MSPHPHRLADRDWKVPPDVDRTRIVRPPIVLGDNSFTVSSGCIDDADADDLWVVQTAPAPVDLGAVRRGLDGAWRAYFAPGVPKVLTDAILAAITAFDREHR